MKADPGQPPCSPFSRYGLFTSKLWINRIPEVVFPSAPSAYFVNHNSLIQLYCAKTGTDRRWSLSLCPLAKGVFSQRKAISPWELLYHVRPSRPPAPTLLCTTSTSLSWLAPHWRTINPFLYKHNRQRSTPGNLFHIHGIVSKDHTHPSRAPCFLKEQMWPSLSHSIHTSIVCR